MLPVVLKERKPKYFPKNKQYTYCSVNRLYVEEVNGKKKLMTVSSIAPWLYCFLTGSEIMPQQFKKQKQIEVTKVLWKLSCDTLQAYNGHINYLRKIIIFCISKIISDVMLTSIIIISQGRQ